METDGSANKIERPFSSGSYLASGIREKEFFLLKEGLEAELEENLEETPAVERRDEVRANDYEPTKIQYLPCAGCCSRYFPGILLSGPDKITLQMA